MSLGENKCLNLFNFFSPSLSVDVLVFIINSSYLQDYPPVPSVGFDLSTGRDVKYFLYFVC